jgi:hypothetical protein
MSVRLSSLWAGATCCARSIAVAALLGLGGLLMAGDVEAASPECTPRGGDPDCGQHNMMIVGKGPIFLSHLPMFESEHRFQVILEVGFGDPAAGLDEVYGTDRRTHPAVRMYTIQPSERFVLSRLFSGDGGTVRRSFPATVFRGHLERGGEPLEPLADIQVTVRGVAYAAEIGPPAGPDRAAKLDYILFGDAAERFLAHRITQPPDFDQLIGVDIQGHDFSPDELKRGVLIAIEDRENAPARRLRAGEIAAARGRVAGMDAATPVQVEVLAEHYFEEGELGTEFTMTSTELEREAGF